ncbi:MAG: alanine racemase [Bdellovibrio sp.]|nr:MAG: alanine racemase [Bdellovibrio sp.]
MLRNTILRVNLSALRSNLRLLKKKSGSVFFCPMVKADAYGLGAQRVASLFEEEGVDALGVALVEEGVELREAGIRSPILIFGGLGGPEDVKVIEENKLTPVVSSRRELEILESCLKGPLAIHLKLNTGMNRLGFSPQEFQEVNAKVLHSYKLRMEGVCTHLVQAEDWGRLESLSQKQVSLFLDAVKSLPEGVILHVFNSSGILSGAVEQVPLGVRPGIALYDGPSRLGFQPVVQWESEVLALHEVCPGEGISYNWTWVAKEKSIIAVIGVGYADGYRRALSNCGKILIKGKRAPVVGTVCMDYIAVDVTHIKNVGVGEKVVLLGTMGKEEISVQEMASWMQTISYEILTGIGKRVPRVYIEANVR